ncbi:hypothetical protein B0H14DRAFT_3148653 [Mycena olivaceomarginata]|nr:hypothetical protein B0H14DRAFT_3148653 [Mycena olivaceomarginata]
MAAAVALSVLKEGLAAIRKHIGPRQNDLEQRIARSEIYPKYLFNEVIPSSNLTLCDFHKLNPENYCLSANANTSPVMLNGVPTDAPVQGVQVDVRAKYVSIFSADIRSRLVREMISVQSKTHARSTQYETRSAS